MIGTLVKIPFGIYASEQSVDRALYRTVEECLSASENSYEVIQKEVWNGDPGFDYENVTQAQLDFEEGQIQDVVSTTRYVGQKFIIQEGRELFDDDGESIGFEPVEYWFKDGIKDEDLEPCVAKIPHMDINMKNSDRCYKLQKVRKTRKSLNRSFLSRAMRNYYRRTSIVYHTAMARYL